MTPARSFTSVFAEACRVKPVPATGDVTLFDGKTSSGDFGRLLVAIGNSKDVFIFTDRGLSFADRSGSTVRYTWDELDFILPFDLSLASDKLYTLSDVSRLTYKIAWPIGLAIAIGGLASMLGLTVLLVVEIYNSILKWIDSFHPFISFFLYLGLLALVVLWVFPAIASISIIAGGIALLITGGALYAAADKLAEVLQPLVERILPLEIKLFVNRLCVIEERWIKSSWGCQTTEILDLILIGVKLRRRGFRV